MTLRNHEISVIMKIKFPISYTVYSIYSDCDKRLIKMGRLPPVKKEKNKKNEIIVAMYLMK